MGGIKINIQGYDKTIAQLKKYPGDKGRAIKLILERSARNIQDNARQILTGLYSYNRNTKAVTTIRKGRTARSKNLHNQIQAQPTAQGATVFVKASYAPYVEFGTGRDVKVPRGLERYAWEFKGDGIKEVDLKARPFMYPAYRLERTVISKKAKEALKKVK